ncbi:MAG: FtsX-like permease family protein [Pyrinomonadaceae bacterium]
MILAFRLAIRFLVTASDGYPRLTTWVAIIGLAFGIASLILVDAVYTAYETGIEKSILAGIEQIVIESKTASKSSPGLVESKISKIENVAEVVQIGTMETLAIKESLNSFARVRVSFGKRVEPISMGKALAGRLSVRAGDEVTFLVPASEGEPSSVHVRIDRIVDFGLYDIDLTTIGGSSEKFPREIVEAAETSRHFAVKLRDPYAADETVNTLSKNLGADFNLTSWRKSYASLFTALNFERRIATLFVSLLVVFASLTSGAVLSIMVGERKREVAILKSCGMRSRDVYLTFLLAGALIALLGSVSGVVLGVFGAYVAEAAGFGLLPSDVYSVRQILIVPNMQKSLFIGAVSFVFCMVAVAVSVSFTMRGKPVSLLRET